MNPEKIGKFICELRKEQNLSQYQLADMIPISRQGVSKWERGKTTPDTQTLIRLSEIFHVSINELLKGERLLNNSIEELEETTLSILDQSNKKTKTIKRITTISISIITTLLLAFLSYYFINSYNTIEVYTIFGQSKNFSTAEGIFIITKEKYYFKLGKLKNKTNAEIENVELYYKLGNKKVVLSKDRDMDDVTIIDSYGYKEKLTKNDINELKNNIYLKITYNEKETSIVKLKFKRDYKNSRLFFINQKVGENKVKDNTTNQEEIRQVDEKKEEEVKPTLQETTNQTKKEEKKIESKPKEEETKKQEDTKEEPKQEEKSKEESQPEQEQQPEEPQSGQEQQSEEPQQSEEIVITTEMVTNKIKEVCPNTNGTYSCNFNNSDILIMYNIIMNKITLYKSGSLVGQYFAGTNSYMCAVDNCETIFDETFKEYLFS